MPFVPYEYDIDPYEHMDEHMDINIKYIMKPIFISVVDMYDSVLYTRYTNELRSKYTIT